MGKQAVSVSVVIPCYNGEATILRALDSVQAQTRPPAQVIVVDDCSDLPIGPRVRRSFPEAQLLRLERNAGPGGARNAGMQMANQRYIAFLDADDDWHPRKLEIQYEWMERHPEAELCGHLVAEGSAHAVSVPPDLRAVPLRARDQLLRNRLQTSSVMMKSSVPERFADGKRYAEDYLLWLQIVLRGGPAYLLELPLAYRHKRVYGAGGLSGSLWRMEAGELDALRRVRQAGLLGRAAYGAAVAWSLGKHLRRVLTSAFVERTR